MMPPRLTIAGECSSGERYRRQSCKCVEHFAGDFMRIDIILSLSLSARPRCVTVRCVETGYVRRRRRVQNTHKTGHTHSPLK